MLWLSLSGNLAISSPLQKKISDESPVGKAMLGHHVGDVVEVETPSGIIEYEVLEIGK